MQMHGDREIRLLGPGLVRGADGRTVEPGSWRTTKTFDVARVLAVAGGPVAIDRLLAHFWPGSDEAHARASLRMVLCQVRKLLGPDVVARTGDAVGMHGVWIDTTAYRNLAMQVHEASDAGRDSEVVRLVRRTEALYAGDIGLAGSDSRWLAAARDELRGTRLRLLLEGVDAAQRMGAWSTSLELAQQAEAIEPGEQAARALMRGWFALGDARRPVQVFEQLRERLAEEYGVDPSPQTRALHLEIVGTCRQWPPTELLVGREAEVRRVAGAIMRWLTTNHAHGGVVWLLGGRGSGREAVAREAARTMLLADGAGGHGHGPLVVVLPDRGDVTAADVATVRESARARGALLLVPVTRLPDGSVADDEVVGVPPLAMADLERLVGTVLQGRPTPRLLRRLHEASGGLPGRACRLARTWLHDGSLSWDVGAVDTGGPTAPEGGTDPAVGRVRVSVGALPPAFQDLLVVAAASSSPLPEDLLLATSRQMCPAAPVPEEGTLETMVDAGLLGRRCGRVVIPTKLRRETLDWARPSLVARARALLDPGRLATPGRWPVRLTHDVVPITPGGPQRA